jgi:hypothetical protein
MLLSHGGCLSEDSIVECVNIRSRLKTMRIDSPIGKNARDIFPDLINKKSGKRIDSLAPPNPPDISWLYDGIQTTGADRHDHANSALVFVAAKKERSLVEKILEKMDYRVDAVPSPVHAMQRLQDFHYKLVICSAGTAAGDLHKYICHIPPFRRRAMYYVLVGPHLHTLYDIEALALSANLVINYKEIKYLKKILEKGFRDYEKLFGPLFDVISHTSSLL